jgi:putative membrane protein
MVARFILRAVFAALGLWLASRFVHGISVGGAGSLIAAAVLLGLANAIVRPIVFVLTLPFVLITFGLFLIVINALMLELVAMMLKGFSVQSFWVAILGSLVVSLVSWVGSMIIHVGEEPRSRSG